MRSSMKRFIFILAGVSLASTPALAQTATFDDLANGSAVPAGYALPGSTWSDWFAINEASASGKACAVSNPNCAYNGFGTPATISRATAFNYTGGYFMAWADNSCGFNCSIALTVTGFNGATQVGTDTFILSPTETQFFASNFSNVDRVTFNTNSGANGGMAAWYLADNLVFNASTVPEPASMTLLGTGLVGLYGVARRRLNKEV